MTELWTLSFAHAAEIPDLARRTERHGWDGLLVADSQNLTGDPYAALSVAATRTQRLLLGTGVTNPVTRHPAVAASAAATVQLYSRGRFALGIGRGDSALSHLGRRPATVVDFEVYLRRLRCYLSGGNADLDGFTSSMPWVAETGLPKVPVDVAATGPKTIAAGARVADRLSFTVGADPERIRWCIGVARKARADAGLDPAGISFGAYVNAVCHPDPAVSWRLVRGSLGVFARFSAARPGAGPDLAADDRRAVDGIVSAYDPHRHASGDTEIEDDFARRFAVIGTPAECVRRLGELIEVGLDRLVIAGHSRDADPVLLAEASEAFGRDVVPSLRG